ncbi:MAG: hypothetical protein E7415_05495 [Ruminococcaceae bacterium]|nr:hypothetical protein [Oscillospiraceae bacterium]
MELFEILNPSGREEKMSQYIKSFAEGHGYSCRCDVFGNLICEKGENIKIAVECGIDNISIMKTAETEKGMLKIAVPNSALVKSLVGKKIKFLNGVIGIVRCDKKEDITDFDLNVDIGANTKEKAEKTVPTGEFATVECEMFENGGFLFGNEISAYAPIMVLLGVMKNAENTAFLFSAQKKFMSRGLNALFENYEAETVISVNALAEKNGISCGKGAVIIIKEKNAVPTVDVRKELINSAETVQIGATDEALGLDAPLIYGKGALCGGVCIPVRRKGESFESIAKSDINSAVEIIGNYLKRGI